MAGLTATGFEAKRAADVLDDLQTNIVARLDARGLPSAINFDDDTVAGIATAALAVALGDIWSAVQSIYDGFDPAAAAGVQLDTIGAIRGGIDRIKPSFSTATVTFTGTNGVTVPADTQVQGDDVDDTTIWLTSSAVIIAGGTADVEVIATTKGAISAAIGVIDNIITSVSGVTAVSNAAAATVGVDREEDTPYRQRQDSLTSRPGGRSAGSMYTAITKLPFIDHALVLENKSDAAAVISGESLDAKSLKVLVYPSGLTSSQVTQLVQVIYAWTPSGIKTMGAETYTISEGTDGAGYSAEISYDYATADPVPIEVTVNYIGLVDPVLAKAEITAAITSYMDNLKIGEKVRLLSIQGALASLGYIDAVAFLAIDSVSADYATAAGDVATISSIVVLP